MPSDDQPVRRTDKPRPVWGRWRKAQGINQESFANMVGLGRHTISQYETGRAIPPIDRAIRMAAALGRSTGEAVTWWLASKLEPDDLAALGLQDQSWEALRTTLAKYAESVSDRATVHDPTTAKTKWEVQVLTAARTRSLFFSGLTHAYDVLMEKLLREASAIGDDELREWEAQAIDSASRLPWRLKGFSVVQPHLRYERERYYTVMCRHVEARARMRYIIPDNRSNRDDAVALVNQIRVHTSRPRNEVNSYLEIRGVGADCYLDLTGGELESLAGFCIYELERREPDDPTSEPTPGRVGIRYDVTGYLSWLTHPRLADDMFDKFNAIWDDGSATRLALPEG